MVAGQIDAGTEPGWAVISETMARKYFGEDEVIGKELILRYPQSPKDRPYRVVAVMKDMPARSSLKADILLDLEQVEREYRYNAGNALTTLLELDTRADVAEVAAAIPEMEGRYSDYEKQLDKTVVLQPLREVYLHSGHIRDYEDVFCYGSSRFNYILCGVALLLSGQMNFIQHKPMGYDNRDVLCVEWPGMESVILPAKEELMRHPDVLAVTNGRPLPMKGTLRYDVYSSRAPENKVKAWALLGDEDYLRTYAIRLAEGRGYRRNEGDMTLYNGAGKPCEAVINRKMVRS